MADSTSSEPLAMTKEQFAELAKGVVEASLKELGMDKTDAKYKVNPQGDEKEQMALKPEERLMGILKGLKLNDKALIEKATAFSAGPTGLDETTEANGQIFVPDVVDASIRELIIKYGIARQEMDILPMGKAKKITFPKGGNSVSVSWPDEGAVKAISAPTFGKVSIECKTLAGITVLTNQLVEDSSIDIGRYVIDQFGRAIAKEEDTQFFTGSGSPFTGVFAVSGPTATTLASTKTKASDATYKDLLTVKNSVPVDYLFGAKWYCHRSFLTYLETIVDGAGRYIFNPDLSTLFGYPVRIIETAPTVDGTAGDAGKSLILLGNMKQAMIGDKSGTSVSLNSTGVITDGSGKDINLFQTNQCAIRVEKRVGFVAAMPTAWAKLKTAAS